MRCWKRPLKLLAICWLCLWAALGAASEVEVRNPQLTPGDDGYTLSADFAFEFNSRLEEAVTRGVVLNFLVEFELTRVRWYWLDDKVASRSQTLRLSYNALTRQYRLSSGALHQNFSSLEEALRILSRLRHWTVLDKSVALRPGETYQASLRLRLDPSQLPKPFQLTALANREWNLASDWLNWPFSVPREEPLREGAK
jgi:hypothetical protein